MTFRKMTDSAPRNSENDAAAGRKTVPRIEEKAWNPSLESEMLAIWEKENLYKFELQEDNFTIDTPPPYPSGRPWHIGAAAHYAQIDMIARTARMSGKNVYFPIGIDRNGLPVEIYTEKKHGIRMRDVERGRFLGMCKEALDDLEGEMILIMKKLGISGQIDRRYRTDTPEYRALTQSTFIDLWKRGRIYLASRPNNYDWAAGTTIADAEIKYEDLDSKLVYIKFADNLTIASTRPELLCSCRAVIVNPNDKRYAGMIGRTVKAPIFGQDAKVIPHPSAKEDFGTGAVMVCSYGDQNDVALFRELGLEEIIAIGMDGRMTDAAGRYAGLRPRQAREKIIADLQDAGFVSRIEDIKHRTPVSERSGVPIEIVPMEEYYMRQIDAVPRMKEMAAEIKFYPDMHRQILLNWLEYVSIDWPISRRRYYGTEIPVWRCKECREPHVPEPGRYYVPWKEPPPITACAKCGSADLEGEARTFDTWMDSSASPLYISKMGKDDDHFKKTYPASIRPQAKDIVRTWLHYTLLKCDAMTGEKPWSEAWIMGYGLDERGLKMSKSKGNAIDPLPVIERLGADAFRYWSASEVSQGYDFRCSELKIENAKKFLSKMWNVARFLSGFEEKELGILAESDRWILKEADALVQECRKGYSAYNFFIPATAIREFAWNVFAAQYMEMVKARAYGQNCTDAERNAAVSTLHSVFRIILKLLAPIVPFIADYLWRRLYSDSSIHSERLPEPMGMDDASDATREISEFNSRVWNLKRSKNLSLRDSISIEIPSSLAAYGADLAKMHNITE